MVILGKVKDENLKDLRKISREIALDETNFELAKYKDELNFWLTFKDKFFVRNWQLGVKLEEVREIHVNDAISRCRRKILNLEDKQTKKRRKEIEKEI